MREECAGLVVCANRMCYKSQSLKLISFMASINIIAILHSPASLIMLIVTKDASKK